MQTRLYTLACRLLSWWLDEYMETEQCTSSWFRLETPFDFIQAACDAIGVPDEMEERDHIYEYVPELLKGVPHGGWDRNETIAKAIKYLEKQRTDYAKRHPEKALIEACNTIDFEVEVTEFAKRAKRVFRDARTSVSKTWKAGECGKIEDKVGSWTLFGSFVALVCDQSVVPFWDDEANTIRFVAREHVK